MIGMLNWCEFKSAVGCWIGMSLNWCGLLNRYGLVVLVVLGCVRWLDLLWIGVGWLFWFWTFQWWSGGFRVLFGWLFVLGSVVGILVIGCCGSLVVAMWVWQSEAGREEKREDRVGRERERIDLFILFVGIIYIILISCM